VRALEWKNSKTLVRVINYVLMAVGLLILCGLPEEDWQAVVVVLVVVSG
jgi:hypothetical protein